MPDQNTYIDYSIVICTHNPDAGILQRCLEAVKTLDNTDLYIEVILVDNNSDVALESLGYMKKYLKQIPSFKIMHTSKQGVQYARMDAIENAKGKYIVYIDDDNEPEKNYLQELKKLNAQYAKVAAWGPGNVSVDFIDGIDASLESYATKAFQERHETEIRYDNQHSWQSCYPFGTGLCMKAFLLKEYVVLAKQGKFTLQGRSGKKLSSGEDTQMILLAISKGYSAGVAPSLQLKHIIGSKKANKKYLKQLAYGTSICYKTCMQQVFPEEKKILEEQILSPATFFIRSLKKLIKAKFSFDKTKKYEAINFIGMNAGMYFALRKTLPFAIAKLIKYLHLK